MTRDIGRPVSAELRCDPSAAMGVAGRRGAGNVRHKEVSPLWSQKHITEIILRLSKESGLINVADIGTKHVDRKTLTTALKTLGYIHVPDGP